MLGLKLQRFSERLAVFVVFGADGVVEAELIYLFTTFDYKGFGIQSEEVEELRFWTKKQVEKNLGKGVFTPNFEVEFELLKQLGIRSL